MRTRRNTFAITFLWILAILPLVSLVQSDVCVSSSVDTAPVPHAVTATDSNYSTFLGGNNTEDATKVTFDSEGNTILIGQTISESSFPVTPNVIQDSYGGGPWDAFVTKFDVNGNLVFSTFLGGNGYEHVTWVTVDGSDNIIVAGTTSSTTFPTTESAYLETLQGGNDGFVSKISPDGETLIFSTLFGGSLDDWIYGMEIDQSGNLMFTGWTMSLGLATSGVIQETHAGNADAFVAKLASNGQNLVMCSYLGGTGNDRGWSMDSDNAHNFVITGGTSSNDFPVTGDAIQPAKGGADDSFLAIVSTDGTLLNYSSYLGGSADDSGLGIKVDSESNIILTGFTSSTDFNVTYAYQGATGGSDDIFVTKVTPDREYAFSTYLGGSGYDRAWELAVDQNDDIIIAGRSTSSDYPVVNAYQDENAGVWDSVVTKMSSDGDSIIRSTYFGGEYTDLGEGVDVDGNGNVVLSGSTSSDDLPISEGAFQQEIGSAPDVFVSHMVFDPAPEEPTTTSSSSSSTSTTTSPTTNSTVGGLSGVLPFALIGVAAVFILILGVVIRSRR